MGRKHKKKASQRERYWRGGGGRRRGRRSDGEMESAPARRGIYVGVVGTAGRLLKGSQERSERRSVNDGCRNKETQIAPLDCPQNPVRKMNFRRAQNNL